METNQRSYIQGRKVSMKFIYSALLIPHSYLLTSSYFGLSPEYISRGFREILVCLEELISIFEFWWGCTFMEPMVEHTDVDIM